MPSGGLSYINTNDIMKTWEHLGTAASPYVPRDPKCKCRAYHITILGFIGTIQCLKCHQYSNWIAWHWPGNPGGMPGIPLLISWNQLNTCCYFHEPLPAADLRYADMILPCSMVPQSKALPSCSITMLLQLFRQFTCFFSWLTIN